MTRSRLPLTLTGSPDSLTTPPPRRDRTGPARPSRPPPGPSWALKAGRGTVQSDRSRFVIELY
eukprot:768779-Hanusia_phi.AAC.2